MTAEITQAEPQELDIELLSKLNQIPIVDQLRKYGGFTAHPDDRVRRNGVRGLQYVTNILRDNHLSSCLETRANNALVPGYAVDAVEGDEDGAEKMRFCLANMDRPLVQILKAIQVNAMGYGFELQQRIWKQTEHGAARGWWTIETLKPIPAELVKFDHDENGAIKDDGIVINPAPLESGTEIRYRRTIFLHAIWGYTYNPYGQSLALDCDRWVWAKDILTKFRLVHAEKYGSPTVMAKLTRQIKRGSQEWNDLVALMTDLQNNSAVVVPQGVILELLQSARSGDLDFDNAYDRGNKEISKRILGSTQTTEGAGHGQSGGYALSRVHGAVTDNYAWIDALWLENIVQRQIVNPIWFMNNPLDSTPPRFRILDDDYAQRMSVASFFMSMVQSGMKIPVDWAHRELNIPKPRTNEPVLIPMQASPSAPAGIDNNLFAASVPLQSSGGARGVNTSPQPPTSPTCAPKPLTASNRTASASSATKSPKCSRPCLRPSNHYPKARRSQPHRNRRSSLLGCPRPFPVDFGSTT